MSPALRRPSLPLRLAVLLCLWVASWLPAASMALSAQRGELPPWTQLCLSSVVVPRGGAPARSADADALFHPCPACQLQAQGLGLPPAPEPVLALRSELRFGAPERFFSAPQGAHAWRPAAARAPPSVLV